jgi:hypothetical protein
MNMRSVVGRLSWIWLALVATLVALSSACGGTSATDGVTGNMAGDRTVATAGNAADSGSGGVGTTMNGPASTATGGVRVATGGVSTATGGVSTATGGVSAAAGTAGADDRSTCATGPARGKTCDDYCTAYRNKCDGGVGYGVYQDISTSDGTGGPDAGRQECLSECQSFSDIYDDDLCCRLGEVAQGSPGNVHCEHALFNQAGPYCPQVVRDTTCATGLATGETCTDYCTAYAKNCGDVGYLGFDDCLFSCKVQSIGDPGSLCCRIIEAIISNGEPERCENARQGRGGDCPPRP